MKMKLFVANTLSSNTSIQLIQFVIWLGESEKTGGLPQYVTIFCIPTVNKSILACFQNYFIEMEPKA